MTDFWVFGYGSLMWRPGFDFVEQAPALLYGVHRSLCIYSVVHRGTKKRPGLVLGLDTGGSCRGIAFKLPPKQIDATVDYLREREQVTSVYVEVTRQVRLVDNGSRWVPALCFVVDRQHTQYAGELAVEEQARLVHGANGQSGPNVEYLGRTVEHLDEIGIADSGLRRVMDAVERRGT